MTQAYCFNCGAKNPDEEDIYYKYYTHIQCRGVKVGDTQYRKASTINLCLECGAAWNAITLAAIKERAA